MKLRIVYFIVYCILYPCSSLMQTVICSASCLKHNNHMLAANFYIVMLSSIQYTI